MATKQNTPKQVENKEDEDIITKILGAETANTQDEQAKPMYVVHLAPVTLTKEEYQEVLVACNEQHEIKVTFG